MRGPQVGARGGNPGAARRPGGAREGVRWGGRGAPGPGRGPGGTSGVGGTTPAPRAERGRSVRAGTPGKAAAPRPAAQAGRTLWRRPPGSARTRRAGAVGQVVGSRGPACRGGFGAVVSSGLSAGVRTSRRRGRCREEPGDPFRPSAPRGGRPVGCSPSWGWEQTGRGRVQSGARKGGISCQGQVGVDRPQGAWEGHRPA